jgi:hypothetical protein
MSKQVGVMGLGMIVLVIALLAGVAPLDGARSRPTTAASTTALPTVTRTPVRLDVIAPTQASTSSETLIVRNTGGEGVSLRRAPGDGERIAIWFDGTELIRLRGEQVAADRIWKQVRDPKGNEGWIAAEFLGPLARTDAALTPTVLPVAAARPSISPPVVGMMVELGRTASTAENTVIFPCERGQIKGNRNTKLYIVPSHRYYGHTWYDVDCFSSEAAAQAAGYRRADP